MRHLSTTAHSLLVMLLPVIGSAQNSYSFSRTSEPYAPLITASACSPLDIYDTYTFTELVGETFWFYGQPFTLDAVNLACYAYNAGSLFVLGDTSFLTIDALNTGLTAIDATSTMTYEVSGTPGQKDLVVQWQNWRLANGPANNFVNCQIILHQATGVIEVRYGPNSGGGNLYTDDSGPFCGITHISNDQTQSYEKLWLTHDANNPTLDSVPNFTFRSLHDLPAPNTVYRFSPRFSVTGVAEVHESAAIMQATLSAAGDRLLVSFPQLKGTGLLSLVDASGRSVGQWSVDQERMSLPLENTPPGIYVLTYTTASARSAWRFARW